MIKYLRNCIKNRFTLHVCDNQNFDQSTFNPIQPNLINFGKIISKFSKSL